MAKQTKPDYYKQIVLHKCLIKEHGKAKAEPVAVGQIVHVPATDANYLIGIKRTAPYDGPEEQGAIVGQKPEKSEKKSEKK